MSDAAYEVDLVHPDGHPDPRLVGELDLANARGLRRRLRDRLTAGIPLMVHILGDPYIDSSPLAVFVEAHKLAVTKGTTFRFPSPTEATPQLLETTTLTTLLTGRGSCGA